LRSLLPSPRNRLHWSYTPPSSLQQAGRRARSALSGEGRPAGRRACTIARTTQHLRWGQTPGRRAHLCCSSSTSRLLPMPASPSSSTTPPRPSRTSSTHRPVMAASSASRPAPGPATDRAGQLWRHWHHQRVSVHQPVKQNQVGLARACRLGWGPNTTLTDQRGVGRDAARSGQGGSGGHDALLLAHHLAQAL
jgi:hypothetical protein